MVNFCAVLGCGNRYPRDRDVSYHCLPVNRPALLKQWKHKIGQQNLPILNSTRVCSNHFVNSKGRKLRVDEVPSLKLPSLPTQVSVPPPCRQLVRHELPKKRKRTEEKSCREVLYCDAETNTDIIGIEIDEMQADLYKAVKEAEQCKLECSELKEKQNLRLNNIQGDNDKIKFYTGFTTFTMLMTYFNFLGEASSKLNYWGTINAESKTAKGRKRLLCPLDEFFMVLISYA